MGHESLARDWDQVNEWYQADREWLDLQRQIAKDSTLWRDSGFDSAYLYRGNRLFRYETIINNRVDHMLSALEVKFISDALHEEEDIRDNFAERTKFGKMLETYRRKARDPETGGAISHQRLSDMLKTFEHSEIVSEEILVNLERGYAQVESLDRSFYIHLAHVLANAHAFLSLTELKKFWKSIKLEELRQNEIEQIFENIALNQKTLLILLPKTKQR